MIGVIFLKISSFNLVKFFLFLIVLNFSLAVQASEVLKFDWEEVEGAHLYEVFVEKDFGSGWKFQIKEEVAQPRFKKELIPGKYRLKIRALDKRRVPSEWSDYMQFNVAAAPVTPQEPREYIVWTELIASSLDYNNSSETTRVDTGFTSQIAGITLGGVSFINKNYGLKIDSRLTGMHFENEVKEFKVLELLSVYRFELKNERRITPGLGVRYSSFPLLFAFPVSGIDRIDADVEVISLLGSLGFMMKLNNRFSSQLNSNFWVPFGMPEAGSIKNINYSGIRGKASLGYLVGRKINLSVGLGMLMESTKYVENLGRLSVFDAADESMLETSQFFVSAGLEKIF